MNIAMPTALTRSYAMYTPNMPGHERLKVGALHLSSGNIPGLRIAHEQTGHLWPAQ